MWFHEMPGVQAIIKTAKPAESMAAPALAITLTASEDPLPDDPEPEVVPASLDGAALATPCTPPVTAGPLSYRIDI